MKVTVKTSAPLKKHLPANAKDNQASIEMPDQSKVSDVLHKLGFLPNENYLITLNSAIVTPSRRSEQILADGDKLTILPPLKGG